jgi:hypothetical protein
MSKIKDFTSNLASLLGTGFVCQKATTYFNILAQVIVRVFITR